MKLSTQNSRSGDTDSWQSGSSPSAARDLRQRKPRNVARCCSARAGSGCVSWMYFFRSALPASRLRGPSSLTPCVSSAPSTAARTRATRPWRSKTCFSRPCAMRSARNGLGGARYRLHILQRQNGGCRHLEGTLVQL